MLSERETALCSAVLALSGTDTMMIPRPVPGRQRLDTMSKSAACLAAPIPVKSIGVTPQSSPDTFLSVQRQRRSASLGTNT